MTCSKLKRVACALALWLLVPYVLLSVLWMWAWGLPKKDYE